MRLPVLLSAAVLAATSFAAPAGAQDRVTAVGPEDAVSTIVTGRTATTVGGLVNNLNQQAATDDFFSGVVKLNMLSSAGSGLGSCSGSLIGPRKILTAAHCVAFLQPAGALPGGPGSDLWGKREAAFVDVRFRPGGSTADAPSGPQDVVLRASQIAVHSNYTGSTVHKNDVAVITLDEDAPDWARRYGLYTGNPFAQQTTFAGWGLVGDGNSGDLLTFGDRRLAGLNRWEITSETSGFNGIGTDIGAALGGNFSAGILMYDFDDGTGARNSSCNVFGALPPAFFPLLCDLGYGDNEVALGRGDSGGGGFINGQVAGVASWVTVGSCRDVYGFGGTGLSCFGAFGGHADVSFAENYNWIIAQVPEPGTFTLMGIGLFGLLAASRRRRAV